MYKERILNKKIEELNVLKTKLVTRSEEKEEVIKEKIRESLEDIELILKDFEYIKDEEVDQVEDEENVDIEMFVKRGGYRCDSQFTVEDLEKYNDKDEELLYISVDGTVYDVSESRFWKESVGGKEASERIFSTVTLENPESLSEGKVVGTLIE